MNMLREALMLRRRLKGEKTTSLQLRLFIFFALFILILALAFCFIMTMSGVFDVGTKESRIWTTNELAHLTDNVTSDFGRLSLEGTAFAGRLALDIDTWLQVNGISAGDLQKYPDKLENLLSGQASVLLSTLESDDCSGVFIILDATVNPDLDNAANSRAGLFLKRTESNAVGLISPKIYYLYGPAAIARENGIGLLGQWRQEFDISDAGFYRITLDTARENRRLAVSRLYYWTERVTLEDGGESALLLCLPLRSSDGTVYGICGMEISAMLFKFRFCPDNFRYPGVFAALSPASQNVLYTNAGLISGSAYLTNPSTGKLTVADAAATGFYTYRSDSGADYIGIHEAVKLYPAGSPYQNDDWALAVIMPQDDWNTAVNGNNLQIYIAVLGLMVVSLLLAVFISGGYTSPVVTALDRIKTDDHARIQKTKIAEIDDLLAYLAAQDEQREVPPAKYEKTRQYPRAQAPPRQAVGTPNLSAYEEFVRNIDTLSAAEKAVFNLYMKGYTAKDISEQLCLSINTIKTHNKRIYTKLNVTSRKELMVYIQMMATEQEKEESCP